MFAAKKRRRYVQNILEIEQLLEDDAEGLDGDKSTKPSDKFYILYKATSAPDYFKPPNHEDDEEEETDRKLLYQCESVETA